MKRKNENSVITPMDERQSQITQKSIVWGFVFLVLCLIGVTVYRIATTGDVGWELFGLIGASAVILISRRLLGDVEQPLDYKNRPLPTGATVKDRMARCKNYAINSSMFGLGFAVLDVLFIAFGENDNTEYELTQILFPSLSKGMTVAVTAVIAFVSMFLISFVFDYLVGEFFKVRRYNQMLAKLAAEEAEE